MHHRAVMILENVTPKKIPGFSKVGVFNNQCVFFGTIEVLRKTRVRCFM